MPKRQPPKSWQERVRARQQTSFVGRTQEISSFELNLSQPPETRSLIQAISGQGGMGKTFLAQRLRAIAEANGAATAWTDHTDVGPVAAMLALATDLDCGEFTEFLERHDAYRKRLREIEADPEVPSGIVEILGRAAGRAGVRAARHIPIAGLALELVDEEVGADIGSKATELARYVGRKFSDSDDVALVTDPVAMLSPFFVTGLNARAINGTTILLTFDTFETTRNQTEDWLLSLLDGHAFGHLPETLMIVVAGRDALDAVRWSPYDIVTTRFSVEAFEDTEARVFLRSRGVTDADTVAEMLRVSQGMPLLLATVAMGGIDPNSMIDASDTAVQLFLNGLDSQDDRRVALQVAAPRRFNADVLEVLLDDKELAAHSLTWLAPLPFVSKRRSFWQYHDVVRELMLVHMRHQSPEAWRRTHCELATYFEATASGGGEWLYHSVASGAEIDDGVRLIVDASTRDTERAVVLAQALAQAQHDSGRDSTLADGLSDAVDGYLSGSSELLVRQYATLLKSSDVTLSEPTLAAIHLALAQLGPADSVLPHLDAAIAMGQQLALAYVLRASVWFSEEEAERALGDLDEAIRIMEADEDRLGDSAPLRTARAIARSIVGDMSGAMEDADEVVRWSPERASGYLVRGRLKGQIGDIPDALADLERARALDDDVAHQALHHAARLMKLADAEGVEGMFRRAIESDEACEHCWEGYAREISKTQSQGESRRLLAELGPTTTAGTIGYATALEVIGGREAAEPLIDDLIEADVGSAKPWVKKSIWLAEDLPCALALLNIAVSKEPGDIRARVLRSQLLGTLGRFAAAEADVDCFIAAVQDSVYARLHRAQLRWKRGNVAGARDDFERVQERSSHELESSMLIVRVCVAAALGAKEIVRADAEELERRGLADNEVGLALSRGGLWKEALLRLERALAESPQALAVNYNRYVALIRQVGLEQDTSVGENLAVLIASGGEEQFAKLYAAAGMAALRGETDYAIGAIGKAAVLNRDVAEWAFYDRAFDSLRENGEFRAILHRFNDLPPEYPITPPG